MSILFKARDMALVYERAVLCDKYLRLIRTTPFIITFCGTIITEFDIHSFIELGLRAVRFKMTNYDSQKEDDSEGVIIKENSIVHVTCDLKYWTKCDEHNIFIDDPYTLPMLVPGTEITIDFGKIVMHSIEKIDDKNVKCKVLIEGLLTDLEAVCVRGIIHAKPALTKKDMEIIDFARTYKYDILTINSVRRALTIQRVRQMFEKSEHKPLLLSSICEQEGLDNMDSIIEASDGIILAREFLAHEIVDKHKMIGIQLYASAKCRKLGKPFYLSGNILEGTLLTGRSTGCDLNDVTNAVLQKSGFVLRKFKDPAYLIKAMRTLNDICRAVEPLTRHDHQFWRMAMEYKMPVNAAEAAVLATVLLAKMTWAFVIIVPTVTGRTVKQVVHMAADNIIIAITSSQIVARQLQLFKGVIAIAYDKKPLRNWEEEMEARIKFAVAYAVKFKVLKRGSHYVVLRKSYSTSSYCDHVSACAALTEEDLIRLEYDRKKMFKSVCEEFDG